MTLQLRSSRRWVAHTALLGIFLLSTGCIIKESSSSNSGDNNTNNTSNNTTNNTSNNTTNNGNNTNNIDSPPSCDEPPELTNDDINGGKTLAADSCYQVTRNLTVSDGILTIEAGVHIVFDQNTGLTIRDAGRLTATSDGAPIVFTGAEPERGFWKGIEFRDTLSSNNVLDNVVIEWAGSSAWSTSNSTAGIYIRGGGNQLALRNSTLRGNAVVALNARHGTAALTLESNHFENNTAPLMVHPNHLADISEDTSFSDNDGSFVHVVGDTMDRERTWPALAVPYRIHGTVEARAKLTLTPGTIFEFVQDAGLSVRDAGRLVADASEGDTIHFRGVESSPSGHGFWKGIEFRDTFSTDNVLHNVEIVDGGSRAWSTGNSTANLYLRGNSLVEVAQTRISNSGEHGISVANGSVLSGCDELVIEGIVGGDDIYTPANNVDNVCDGNF